MAVSPEELTANLLVQSVPIVLDKPRKLTCDFAALAIIEAEFGIDALDGEQIAPILESRSVRKYQTLLYALLQADDPTLTREEAGHLVGYQGFPAIKRAVIAAFVAGLPEVQPAEASPTGEEAAPLADA